ncbi:MAG TPA: M20/M25/M40 family metallo-hydrolase [Pyrinomonadaceae bacterium]|nr:M20/M25/M40 family metallo-hydrolase [Pyrinomonadaceae bacterium]
MRINKFARTYYILVLAATISVVAALGQQSSNQSSPSPELLRRHVSYLASDALEGRRTGTAGANDAAHYIAGEFSRLGLRPAIQMGRAPRNRGEALSRFLQRFPYVAGVELGRGNELSLQFAADKPSTTLKLVEDWMPLGLSVNGRLENTPAIFVGYGITASELNHNDYPAAAAGKIAIALSGTPDGDNPHGQFARYEDVRWKAIAARNAGAKALVVIAGEETFKDDRLARLRYDNSAGDAGLLVIGISRQVVDYILKTSGSSLADLENSLKASTRAPIKFPELSLTLATDIVRREVVASNVIGILEGADPILKKEAIVVGAHYDHLGRGGEGSLAQREGDVHHGADDNASGVAGMMEIARLFVSDRPKPRRTIVFIAFSGEEEGLLGSNYYVNHPIIPLGSTVAMINMDMIGRMKDDRLIIGGLGTSAEWRRIIENANPTQNSIIKAGDGAADSVSASSHTSSGNGSASNGRRKFQLSLNEDGYGPSDHSSFYAKQIPVLFFWTGTHEDYHKPSDTADRINYADEARILVLVSRVMRDIDGDMKRPTYTVARSESAGRSSGFRVYLGTIPNYADANNGLLLDGVRNNSPAEKAGLKAGDRIVMIAGREVRNVYDYTYALGEMKAGQEYEVEVWRGAERLKFKLTPAARR